MFRARFKKFLVARLCPRRILGRYSTFCRSFLPSRLKGDRRCCRSWEYIPAFFILFYFIFYCFVFFLSFPNPETLPLPPYIRCNLSQCLAYTRQTGMIPTPSSRAPPTTKTQPSSLALLPRFSSRLQLPYKCESLASAICTASVDVIPTLGSRHPASIAGVAIFMASLLLQEKRAIKDVTKAAGIGAQTIRRLYKVFWRVKEALLEAAAAEGNLISGKILGWRGCLCLKVG